MLSKVVHNLQRLWTRTPIRDQRRTVRIMTPTCVITMGVVAHRTHTHMTRMQRRTTPITTIIMEAIQRHTRPPLAIHMVLLLQLQGQVIGPLLRDTRHIRPPRAMHHHQATAILRHRAMVRHLQQVTRLPATRRLVILRPRIHHHQEATCHHHSPPLVTLRIRHPILLVINSLPLAMAMHRLLNEVSRRAVPRALQTTWATVSDEIANVGARHLQGLVAWMEAVEADQAREGNSATRECLGSWRLQNCAAAGCWLLACSLLLLLKLLLSFGRSNT